MFTLSSTIIFQKKKVNGLLKREKARLLRVITLKQILLSP